MRNSTSWSFARAVFAAAVLAVALPAGGGVGADFRVEPYLQNPASDAVTIRWLSHTADPGMLTIDGRQFSSTPAVASTLDYQTAEPTGDRSDGLPYLHSIRVPSLAPGGDYSYSVVQGSTTKTGRVITPLAASATSGLEVGSGVRLFVYADSETEPESATKKASWMAPSSASRPVWANGQYLATQSEGYARNLAIIGVRAAEAQAAGRATLVAVAGDLVESGGEQRDWDEFWRHNAGPRGSLASSTAIVPALGNHDNYGGPGELGGYSAQAAVAAADKFRTYFDVPSNGASVAGHQGRYHRVDFGPVTLLTIDSSNGGLDNTSSDTNLFLEAASNRQIPDFLPGSEQYQWLEAQLQSAQTSGQLVFVQYHHAAYSVGPHGFPAGSGAGFDTQSGQPMRMLTPLFAEYGVAAVFSGHDEMYEHSLVDGIHFFDVGIGGDGLRGPEAGLTNPGQVFLAHDDAPEVWSGDVLVSGGKHYGHLEIDVLLSASGLWDVSITPAYAFPLLSATNSGEITRWERRTYEDAVTFVAVPEPGGAWLALPAAAIGLSAAGLCGRKPGQ